MDFSKLTRVARANPKEQDYDLRWNQSADKFTFSDNAYAQLQVHHNSLTQYDDSDKVYLAVCPGDSGEFFRSRKGLNKGKAFKNSNLAEALKKVGLTDRKLRLLYEGENEGMRFYQIDVNAVKTLPQEEQTQQSEQPVADQQPAEVQPQNDSF